MPDAAARAEILGVHLHTVPHQIKDEQISLLARDMHGYVGADIAAVVTEAALSTLNVEGRGLLCKARAECFGVDRWNGKHYR